MLKIHTVCRLISMLSVAVALGQNTSSTCKPLNYCTQTGADTTCIGFETFAQIDPTGCTKSDQILLLGNITGDHEYYYPSLTLYGDRSLTMDKTLNLNSLFDLVFGLIHGDFTQIVRLFDINGFDLNMLDTLESSVRNYHITYLQFNRMKLNLYLNGKQLDTSCQNTEWLNMSVSVFSLIPADDVTFTDSYFPTSTCPTVFHKSEIKSLTILGAPIEFDSKYSFLGQIDSQVYYYELRNSYRVDLSNKTLPVSLFQHLTEIRIQQCSVHTIQLDMFKDLNSVRKMKLMLINLRYFFHFNQIEWMQYLNVKNKMGNFYLANSSEQLDYIRSSLLTLEIVYHLNDNDLFSLEFFPYIEYQFQDEDFCLFASFPHENLILPDFHSEQLANCSCTLIWIRKFVPFYNRIGLVATEYYSTHNECFQAIDEQSCHMAARIKNCSMSQKVDDYQPHYFDFYDLKNSIYSLKIIVRDTLGPIFSALAMLTNLFTFLTIRLSPKKKQGTKITTLNDHLFYRYMKWNAVLNIICATIYFFFYTIKCNIRYALDKGNVPDLCFQQEVYINTVTSTLKLMANFSFLQMCLNRFVLVGKDHSEFIISLSQYSPRKFFFISFILSSILSVIIYFKEMVFGSQTPNDGMVIDEEFYYHEYYWYWNSAQRLPYVEIIADKFKQLPVISAFMFIHDFFSYLFFCLASTIIDALTVKNLRHVLSEKKRKSAIDHEQESRRAEIKSIIMIVLSSFFNFVLRFPELFSTVFFYSLIFNKQSYYTFKMLCYSYRECLPIVEITNVFFILSLSLNFIFYVAFDNNFKKSFLHLLSKCFIY